MVTDPQTHTNRQDRLQYTALLSAQCNNIFTLYYLIYTFQRFSTLRAWEHVALYNEILIKFLRRSDTKSTKVDLKLLSHLPCYLDLTISGALVQKRRLRLNPGVKMENWVRVICSLRGFRRRRRMRPPPHRAVEKSRIRIFKK